MRKIKPAPQQVRPAPTAGIFKHAQRLRPLTLNAGSESTENVTREAAKSGHMRERTKAALPARQIDEARVAREQFVAAQSRNCHFKTRFPRSLGHEPSI